MADENGNERIMCNGAPIGGRHFSVEFPDGIKINPGGKVEILLYDDGTAYSIDPARDDGMIYSVKRVPAPDFS